MRIIISLLAAALVTGNALAQDGVIVQAYRTVNVRSGPGTQYDIIGQLTSGDEVQVTGRSDDESNWLRIEFAGREGWVAYFTVTVLGDAANVEIVVPREEQVAPPAATPTAQRASSDVFVTAYRTVNVRTGPGMNYVQIDDLDAGSMADVTGRSVDNRWLRIEFGTGAGWVAFFVVSLSGSLDQIDIVEAPSDAETEEPPNSVEIVTRYNVNLHADPLLASPVVDVVPYDTTLQAQARSDAEGTWLQVTYAAQVGWLIRTLISAHADLSVLPVRGS